MTLENGSGYTFENPRTAAGKVRVRRPDGRVFDEFTSSTGKSVVRPVHQRETLWQKRRKAMEGAAQQTAQVNQA